LVFKNLSIEFYVRGPKCVGCVDLALVVILTRIVDSMNLWFIDVKFNDSWLIDDSWTYTYMFEKLNVYMWSHV